METRPTTAARSQVIMPQGLGSAIAAVLASDLPDHPAARRSDIDLVLGARRLERNRLGTQSKASYETALIWVLVYVNGHWDFPVGGHVMSLWTVT